MAIKISNNTVIDDSRNSTLNSLTFSSDTSPTFVGTGSVSSTTLTIEAVTSGTIAVGDLVYSSSNESSTSYLHPFTYITAFGTGTGGTGTYTISESTTSGTVASTTILCGPNYKNNSITFTDTDTSVATSESNRVVGNISWWSSDSSAGGVGPRAFITGKYSPGVSSQGAMDLLFGAGPFGDNYADPAMKINGSLGTIEFLSSYTENGKDYGTVSGTAATLQIQYKQGNYFKFTNASTSMTISFLNAPAGNATFFSFILDITNGGSSPITWFTGTKWVGGTAPTLTASGRDVLGFYTSDYGSTYTGLVLGKDVK